LITPTEVSVVLELFVVVVDVDVDVFEVDVFFAEDAVVVGATTTGSAVEPAADLVTASVTVAVPVAFFVFLLEVPVAAGADVVDGAVGVAVPVAVVLSPEARD